jgi:hypothetical protein
MHCLGPVSIRCWHCIGALRIGAPVEQPEVQHVHSANRSHHYKGTEQHGFEHGFFRFIWCYPRRGVGLDLLTAP